jgi:hypothetical protein
LGGWERRRADEREEDPGGSERRMPGWRGVRQEGEGGTKGGGKKEENGRGGGQWKEEGEWWVGGRATRRGD